MKTDKFPSLLKFLLNQKRAIEYENAELRNDSQVKGFVHLSEKNDSKVITSDIQAINLDGIHRLFRNVTKEEITRPTGEVDVLIGFEYAGFHPQTEQSSEHLLLLKNRFGKCIGGTHPQIKETNERHELNSVQVLHSTSSTVEDFYNIENLGIECSA